MKIDKLPFNPITITLESEAEVYALTRLLGGASRLTIAEVIEGGGYNPQEAGQAADELREAYGQLTLIQDDPFTRYEPVPVLRIDLWDPK